MTRKHGWDRARSNQRPAFTSSERRAVMRRDGYSCYVCGRYVGDWKALDVDHKIPLAERGAHSFDNWGTICRTPCHRDKSRAESERGFARKQALMRLPEDPHPFTTQEVYRADAQETERRDPRSPDQG